MTPASFYHDNLVKDDAERAKLHQAFGVLADGANASLKLFLRYTGDIMEAVKDRGQDPIHAVPALLILDFAEAMDGVVLLVRVGAAKNCLPILRQALETKLLLQYLTQDKATYERRCLAYEYWQLLGQLEWARKFDPEHDAGKAARREVGEYAGLLDEQHVPGLIEKLEERLKTSTRYEAVRTEKDRMEAEALRKLEEKKGAAANGKERKACRVESWHRLWGGPGNVREIAREVGEPHAYESFYRMWSESVHGAAAGKRIAPESGDTLSAHPLRHPGGLYKAGLCAQTFCLTLGTHLVRWYLPDRLEDFANYAKKNVLPHRELMEQCRGLN